MPRKAIYSILPNQNRWHRIFDVILDDEQNIRYLELKTKRYGKETISFTDLVSQAKSEENVYLS